MSITEDVAEAAAVTGIHEDPVPFGEHTYIARRNEGELRYQIFRNDEVTPVGSIEAHRCEYSGGAWKLRVYDANGLTIGRPSRHGADHPDGGCVHSYINALSHIRMGRVDDDS